MGFNKMMLWEGQKRIAAVVSDFIQACSSSEEGGALVIIGCKGSSVLRHRHGFTTILCQTMNLFKGDVCWISRSRRISANIIRKLEYQDQLLSLNNSKFKEKSFNTSQIVKCNMQSIWYRDEEQVIYKRTSLPYFPCIGADVFIFDDVPCKWTLDCYKDMKDDNYLEFKKIFIFLFNPTLDKLQDTRDLIESHATLFTHVYDVATWSLGALDKTLTLHGNCIPEIYNLLPIYEKASKEINCSCVILAHGSCIFLFPEMKRVSALTGWDREKRYELYETKSQTSSDSGRVMKEIEKTNDKEFKRILETYNSGDQECIFTALLYLQENFHQNCSGCVRHNTNVRKRRDIVMATWTEHIAICTGIQCSNSSEKGPLPLFFYNRLYADWLIPRVIAVIHPKDNLNVCPEWKGINLFDIVM